jgi:hypothetical protein
MSNRAINWAYKQDVKPAARKFLLVTLADFADEAGSCFPKHATLARMTGQTERAVQDHIKALEDEGYLTRERGKREDGTWTSYRYILPVDFQTTEKQPENPPEDFVKSTGNIRSDHRKNFPVPPEDFVKNHRKNLPVINPHSNPQDNHQHAGGRDAFDWAEEIRQRLGWPPARNPIAESQIVTGWVTDGIDVERIALPTVLAVAADAERNGRQISSLRYFDRAVREAVTRPPGAGGRAGQPSPAGYAPDPERVARRREYALANCAWEAAWGDPPPDIAAEIDSGQIRIMGTTPTTQPKEAAE